MDTEKNDSFTNDAASSESDMAEQNPGYRNISTVPMNPDAEKGSRDAQNNRLTRVLSLRPSIHADPGPPPDGGINAYTQMIMGHLVIVNTWGYIASFGAFQAYYVEALGHPPSAISWIGAVQIFLLFFVGTFSGRALDAGLFKITLITGLVIQLIGVFTTSVATKYWQLFLAQGICTGIGNGIQFCPAVALVATYFSKKRSMALAFCACGGAVGGMIFPAMVSRLLPTLGQGWMVRVLGFVQLGIGALTITFMRTRIPPRKSGPLVDWSAFKESPYVLFIIGMSFKWWGLYFAIYYIGAYARDIVGLSYSEGINLIITMNGVGVIGRLLPAFLADWKFGPLNCMFPLGLVSGIIVFGWAGIHSKGGLYAFAVLYGLAANGIQGLWPATLASLTTDLSKTGTRMGMAFTIISFFALTGEPLGGALIQANNGNYLYAQMWCGSSLILGGLILFYARIRRTGFVLKARV